jgi:chemotaxis protein CheZ
MREVLEAAAPGGEEAEFADLATAAEKLGGRLIRPSQDGHERRLEIEFPVDPGILNRVEACLLFHDVTASVSGSTAEEGEVLEEVIDGIKEFMMSFAAGDVERAQQILLDIAQCRHPALYKEIGLLARELHTSLRDFQLKLDPALKEIVQDRLPDSGNRLEHIIQLTENAANVTMDHVEAIQRRNEEDQGRASRLKELAQALYPVGDQAARRLEGILSEVTELEADLSKNHEDLLTILTAQDYQDLTGQIILKIIRLLNDLEGKLLHLIKSFGVRVESETGRRSSDGELYGPAHKDVESALHSQDDVDAMLAEFGF